MLANPEEINPQPPADRSVRTLVQELRRQAGARHVILARRDGLPVATTLPAAANLAAYSHMAAAIAGTSDMAGEQLQFKSHEQTIVDFDSGKALIVGCGDSAVIMLLLPHEANLGLAIVMAKRAAEEIRDLLPPWK